MLRELRIQNFAIIDDLRISFGPGLNVITGETGSGKSMIIGALTLLSGGRANTDVVRRDCDDRRRREWAGAAVSELILLCVHGPWR